MRTRHTHNLYTQLVHTTCPAVSTRCIALLILAGSILPARQGGPNLGRERAVAYVVLGVGVGAVDNSNFSPRAIRDESPRVLEQLPSWDDW